MRKIIFNKQNRIMMNTVKHQEERRIILRLEENEEEEVVPPDQVHRRKRLKKCLLLCAQHYQEDATAYKKEEEAKQFLSTLKQDHIEMKKCTSAKLSTSTSTLKPLSPRPPSFTTAPSRTLATVTSRRKNKMSISSERMITLFYLIAASTFIISLSFGQILVTANAALDRSQLTQEGSLKQPESLALTSASGTTNINDNNKQQESTNVIIIKYANVTSASSIGGSRLSPKPTTTDEAENIATNSFTPSDSTQSLHIFKLYEPLSVSVIESKFSSSIQLFDVSENQLSTLSNNLFCPLSNEVRQLNISHNLLENFDSLGLISQAGQLCLSELRVLDMSFNLIKHLPATGVATLQNLEVLNLSNNLLESLDELSLSSLFKLTTLDLSGNKLQQLPVRLFQKSSSMQVLKLQSNQLQTSISQLFLAGLVSLEELDLSYNKISQIIDSPFLDKVNLTRVDLSHNQLTSLRQDALKVTSIKQASSSYRPKLLHNGQYAGLAMKQVHSQSVSAEFYLNSNPFICDCQLEWMAKYQLNPSAMKRTVLSPTNNNRAMSLLAHPTTADLIQRSHHHHETDQLGAQLMQLSSSNVYQNDQPPSSVIFQAPPSSSDSSSTNNISEIPISNQQQTATDMGTQQQSTVSNSGSRLLAISPGNQAATNTQLQTATHLTHHYARIGDLDLIKCTPLFRRNTHHGSRNPSHHPSSYHRHHQNFGASGHQQRPLAPPDGSHLNLHHQHHILARQQVDHAPSSSMMIDLLGADSSNFLCRYKSHCFALCQCCEFDACDCEMICPSGCNCFYDSTWQTNIIDCSSNNHTVVPDRIPMDVSGLYLDGNNIDLLKPSNLIARKLLKTLYLNSSSLQTIANRTFNGLIELQTLYLNDNQLRTLNGYEFEPLAQLKALYLQSNRLDHVSNQTFIYLRSLEVLDLSNNRLTVSNLDLFWSIGHHNIRLRHLSIAHNWWSCQCNSINRFRQILKQKFLLNGSVNIVDKNQLRCYYNSSTVGPLILAAPSGDSLYSSTGIVSSQRQSQQQQLTEINKCSESIEEYHRAVDVNPPFIQPAYTDLAPFNTPGNEYPNDPNDFFQPGSSSQNSQQQHHQYPQIDPQIPSINSPPHLIVQSPSSPDIHTMVGIGGSSGQYLGNTGGIADNIGNLPSAAGNSSSIPLTSFILLCVLFAIIMVIGVSIFLFVRQQQQQQQRSRSSYHHQSHHHHHKKSSAASTTSASSSASSTAISSLNGKSSATSHHPHQHHRHHLQNASATMHNPLHHHLIMSNGSSQAIVTARAGTGTETTQHPPSSTATHNQSSHHHQHSASSQSNIYAALVSPTNTLGASAAATLQQAGFGQSIINNQQQQHNLYSNSSSTASHHSTGSTGNPLNTIGYQQHWQVSQQANNQHPQYNAYSSALENHYTVNASSQASYKTSSLYNSHYHKQAPLANYLATSGTQQQSNALDVQATSDWIKLPKVKQFMSKLVNKSLALGGLRSFSSSRDELSANTIDKIYDAFISYDKRDQAFVMQHLSSELEYGQPQYRIADRFRDLPQPSSAYLAEAITSVIGCSHRTIVVLTENYLSSEWSRYELQAALHESALDKWHKIIAVVLDPKCLTDMDPEMRALLTNCGAQVYQATAPLVQLDSAQEDELQQQHQHQPALASQLVATLTGNGGANQQVLTNCTAQLATSRISFLNFNERKFWHKLKQLMPAPRQPAQTLTLTTKN